MRALLLVIALVLAGCANQAPEPEPEPEPVLELATYWQDKLTHAVDKIVPVAFESQGATLRGHVYIPDGEGPFATVLEYSPYFDGQQSPSNQRVQTVDGRLTMTGNHQILLEAGFAIALVNMRGTGTSDGCVHWGPEIDWLDVYEVVEGLAAKEWSNGNVGMVGTSYPGWTQFMALASQPPSLKAVIPVSGVIDLYSLLARNGATLSVAPVVTTQWHGLYSLGEATYVDDRGGDVRHAECGPRILEDAQETLKLYAQGDRNAYWDARDIRDEISESRIPILLTNGLTDGEGHVLQVEGLWDLLSHDNKRMLLGQWGHGGTAHPSGDWPLMRVAWFDHFLRDGPKLVETGVVDYQDDLGNWHTTDQWPPAGNDTTVYFSDGSLVADADAVRASQQMFQSIHANPCPGLCADHTVDAPELPVCGPHHALYVSPPLQEDVLLAGNFHVNFTLSSTQPNGNLAVFLYRTTGDGTCPDTSVVEVRRALSDLRHAQEPGHPGADFPLNTPTEVNLVSHPFASPIKAGERLVLAVGGGALELTPDARAPVLTVHTGGLGQVTVTVVDGELVFGS